VALNALFSAIRREFSRREFATVVGAQHPQLAAALRLRRSLRAPDGVRSLSLAGVKLGEELPSASHVVGGTGVKAPPVGLVVAGAVAEKGVCLRLVKVEENRCGRCRWR
jgi:hypothetical protein